jgi:hypothetical protein
MEQAGEQAEEDLAEKKPVKGVTEVIIGNQGMHESRLRTQ